jgi:hypothetical protein
MRSLAFALSALVSWTFAGCGHIGVEEQGAASTKRDRRDGGKTSGATRGPGKGEIVLAPELLEKGSATTPSWLAYGASKALAIDESRAANPNAGVTDFDTEYVARAALVDTWKELREKDGAKDAYLDLLVTVKDAGFLDEYVILSFSRPGWTIPAKFLPDIHISEFLAWATAHLPKHQVATLAEVHSEGMPQNPRVLGDGLPAPQDLSPEKVPCQQSMRRLMEARQAWLAESKNLAATPLAAADRQQFVGLLRWAREYAPDYPGGVVWVSRKAYSITFFTGYCAVDQQDHRAAIPILRAAVSLVPLSPEPRSELVQALAQTKQLAAAMDEVDRLLQLPMGKCYRGIAWRKRGFLLFELGKLKEAYAAYQKSLEFDPGSKIAFDEMTLLARELLRTGQITSGEKGRYTPPPAGPQVTTRCTDD